MTLDLSTLPFLQICQCWFSDLFIHSLSTDPKFWTESCNPCACAHNRAHYRG